MTENPTSSKFCSGCGARLDPTTATSITDERLAMDRWDEATAVLGRARVAFEALRAAPSLGVVDLLLDQGASTRGSNAATG